MKARYIRVSTSNQNSERQLRDEFKNERLFIDVISGAIPFNERIEGQNLIDSILKNEINYVSVHSIDRLGRNLFDILSTLEIFNKNKVILKVDNLGLESLVKGKPNQAFKLIISVMANIAEMERETMLERQKEGIRIAKANGVYKGRVRGSIESDNTVLTKHKAVVKYLKKKHSLRNTAKLSGVSLGTVQKVQKILKKTESIPH
ncbi:recombinase family protein [Thalassobellus citreus]|uniref:recombinase family protein n=1 Tax=Thalassobellus citreus TaxID=3367752 RepID=UPI0037A74EA4